MWCVSLTEGGGGGGERETQRYSASSVRSGVCERDRDRDKWRAGSSPRVAALVDRGKGVRGVERETEKERQRGKVPDPGPRRLFCALGSKARSEGGKYSRGIPFSVNALKKNTQGTKGVGVGEGGLWGSVCVWGGGDF